MAAIDDWKDKMTFGQALNETVAKFGDREAWIYRDERVTFRTLRQRVDRLAGGLLRLGVKKGDKVCIWMPNRLEWIYTYFATVKIGAAIVPLNTRFRTREAQYIIGHSDSTTLLLTDKYLNADFIELIRELCPELAQAQPGRLESERLPKLRNVICASEQRYDGMYSFDDVLALGNDFPVGELQAVEAAADPDGLMLMIYTSGSTGFPKGVMHSHKVMRNMSDLADRLGATEQDCNLLYLPLFHGYGAVGTVVTWTLRGGRGVLMDKFDAGEALRLMEKERVSVFYGMETIYHDLFQHPSFGQRDLSSLRVGVCPSGMLGQAPMVREVAKVLNVRGASGMTELTAFTSLSLPTDSVEKAATTSGYPLPGFKLKIVDPETGKRLPPNTPGELCASGHPVMLGYYKLPEETARVMDGEGYFHTGDLCTLDEQGYLRFMTRIKDLFRVGGEHADPMEVEGLLMEHPAIGQVCVTGVPDKRLGEVGAAFVQFKRDRQASEQELIDYCKGKIAGFKVPRYVIEVDEFPLLPVGKVHKQKLREMAVQQLGLEE